MEEISETTKNNIILNRFNEYYKYRDIFLIITFILLIFISVFILYNENGSAILFGFYAGSLWGMYFMLKLIKGE